MRVTFFCVAMAFLNACRTKEQVKTPEPAKAIDCVAAFYSEDTSQAVWKCRDSLRDSIDHIIRRKEDSTRYAAFFDPDTAKRADFIIDYSYEEGVFSLIAWKNGLISVHDGKFPPKPKPIDLTTIELKASVYDSLMAHRGKEIARNGWKISRSADYRTFVNIGGEFYESRVSECVPNPLEVCQPLTRMIINMFRSKDG